MLREIGDCIREARKNAGLNQEQLSELSRLNRVTIAKYESGKIEPGAQALTRIADALGVTVDELLGRKQLHPPETEETFALREKMRRDPAFRLLFAAADKASPEHIKAAAAMLKSLEGPDDD